jgi:hypothetical protein
VSSSLASFSFENRTGGEAKVPVQRDSRAANGTASGPEGNIAMGVARIVSRHDEQLEHVAKVGQCRAIYKRYTRKKKNKNDLVKVDTHYLVSIYIS